MCDTNTYNTNQQMHTYDGNFTNDLPTNHSSTREMEGRQWEAAAARRNQMLSWSEKLTPGTMVGTGDCRAAVHRIVATNVAWVPRYLAGEVRMRCTMAQDKNSIKRTEDEDR